MLQKKSITLEVLDPVELDGVPVETGLHRGYLTVHPRTKEKKFWISPKSHTDDFNVTAHMGREVRSV